MPYVTPYLSRPALRRRRGAGARHTRRGSGVAETSGDGIMSNDFGAAAPMWPPVPPMPPHPPTVGRGPWWRRRKGLLGLGVFAVVAGLVAGLLVWQGSRTSKPDGTPFVEALADLAAQPAIGYRTSVGSTTVDMQVTYAGDVLGSVTVLGKKVSTLTVNGTSYVKMPNWLGGSDDKDPTGLAGRWITGKSAASTAGTSGAASASSVQTPAALANRLYPGLSSASTVLDTAKSEADSVDGTPAMKATTPDGELYVTRTSPYRLLRFVPKAKAGLPSGLPTLPSMPSGLPSLPSGFPSLPSGFPTFSLPALPSGLGLPSGPGLAADSAYRMPPARYAAAPAGTLDFSRMSPQDVRSFYSRLEGATKELKQAVDADIAFTLDGKADLTCSSGGCTVVAHVTSNVRSGDPRARITGGKVNATLTATVEVEGQGAGGCTATAVLPLTGTSDIACDDAAAGPVFAEVEAEKKAEAEQESEAEGGAPVPYTVSSAGQASVEAMATVDVDALLLMEELEQQIIEDFQRPAQPTAPPTPSASGSATQAPTLVPTQSPTARPSGTPTVSPTAPPAGDRDEKRRKPTCIERRPDGAENNGPDEGWTYYSEIGWKQRAFGAVACLATEASGGTAANSNSPGMDEARKRAKELFPNSKEPYLVNSCHLIPNMLGGRGVTANLSPCWTRPINVGEMTDTANCVAALMRSGIVQMTVVPNFSKNTDMVPYSFSYRVEAWDRQGDPVAQTCSRVIVNEKEEKLLNGHN